MSVDYTCKKSVYSEKSGFTFLKSIFVPSLRPTALKCMYSIFINFFFLQWRCTFLPGRIPVSYVDHPLDEKIPFVKSWVTIYLDFAGFWIRMLSFFLRRYKRRAYKPVKDFIQSMNDLYCCATDIYRKNLSTAKRPFYIARPRFLLIHLLDPHLMCIPSLHIMVAIHTYKMFSVIAEQLGEKENLKEQIIEMEQGALAISQAVLYVKQHSVNCIPAALYAMTCITTENFPVQEAERFNDLLFSRVPDIGKLQRMPQGKIPPFHPAVSPKTKLPESVQAEIKSYIISLYRQFLSEKENAETWDEPILNFLKSFR